MKVEDKLMEVLALTMPIGLALYSDPKYRAPPHLQKLNKCLLKLSRGDIKRLMVFMPPRHGKSELCSKYFPAWYLGTHPDDRVILASYGADFAAIWGSKVRDLLRDSEGLFGVSVDINSGARNRWDIQGCKGGMYTAGVGGSLTGKGAEVLIIDDPVKNAEQANSPTYRERAKEWYRSTAYTRLTSSGKVIFIQTRWHEDDLGGWLLNNNNDDWTVLSFPAIAEEEDVLGRVSGDALWPGLWPLKSLKERESVLGEYWFSALYQQRPQPAEGGILKRQWLKYHDNINRNFKGIYTGWDLAISTKETADYTASCTIGVDYNNDIYVLDWTRDRLLFPEQLKMVNRMYDRWNPLVIGVESTAYQAALPQAILAKRLLPIRNVKPVRDKVTRITGTFTAFEQGKVFLPPDHPLLGDFESEFVTFPSARHDDLLDATEIALSLARAGENPYSVSELSYTFSGKNRGYKGNNWRFRCI